MTEILKSSLIWRLFAALALLYRRSPLPCLLAAVGRCWRNSAIYGFFARRLQCEPAVGHSALQRILDRLNHKLYCFGQRLSPVLHGSLLYRAYAAVFAAGRGSKILGALFSGGMTAFLLFLISSYAVVDYLLRDVLQFSAVASIWDEVLILFGFVWILFRRIHTRKPLRSALSAVDLSISFYLVVGLLLLLYIAPAPSVNFLGFRASMQYLLLFFLVTRLIRDDRDFQMMYGTMLAIAMVIALHGVWQFVVGVEIPTEWTDAAEGAVRTRVFSIFSNPNILGAYMLMFAPMAIGRAYASETAAEKIFFWICGIVMCLACLFTMSRGAWMALAVAAVVFALLVDRKLLALMLVAGVFACFLPFVRSRIGYLFTAEFAASNAKGGRGKRWSTAIGYLKANNVWLGMGYGMYGGAVAAQNPVYPWIDYMYVDNYYVKILTENGIIGLSAFLLTLCGLIWNGLRACARTVKSRMNPLCAGMLAGLIGVLVQSFFECIWEEPYMMALFFAIAGMLIYAGFLSKPQKK